MSSRAFDARTGAGLCGLCGVAFQAGERAFYLTCAGDGARRESQVERSDSASGYSTGFRSIPSGTFRTVGRGRYSRQVAVFKWQERRGSRWFDLAVWEQMCHVACASTRGYRIPSGETTAKKGTRTEGHAHRVAEMAQAVANVEAVAVQAREESPVSLETALTEGGTVAPAINVTEMQPSSYLASMRAAGGVTLVEQVSLLPPPAPERAPLLPSEGRRVLDLDDTLQGSPVNEVPAFKPRPLDLD